MSLHNAAEQLVNGITIGATYAVLGASLGIIISVTKRFHFAYAWTYAAGGYVTAVATERGLPLIVAVILGVLTATVLGIAIEAGIYRQVATAAPDSALLNVFIAALGITIAGENALELLWPGPGRSVSGNYSQVVRFHGIYVTRVALIATLVCAVIVALLTGLLRYGRLSRSIRAVRADPDLAQAFGIRAEPVYLIIFAVCSACGAILAIFATLELTATSDMGTDPVLYGIIIAFVAGSRSPALMGLVGLVIGILQSLSTLFVSAAWTEPAIFGLLIVYVLAVRNRSTAMELVSF